MADLTVTQTISFMITFGIVVAGSTAFIVKQSYEPAQISQRDIENITKIRSDLDYIKEGMADLKQSFKSAQENIMSLNQRATSLEYRVTTLEKDFIDEFKAHKASVQRR